MTQHHPIQVEVSDLALDAMWAVHFEGGALPAEVRACMTIQGPQIEIRHGREAHLWLRHYGPGEGRHWQKVGGVI